MLLFRSEEHITRWLDGRPAGRTTSAATLCDLAHAWWGDRLDPGWRPRPREASPAILDRLLPDDDGRPDPFWRLPG